MPLPQGPGRVCPGCAAACPCREFKDNAVRLQLFVLAYKCAVRRPNFLRRLALPRSIRHWSLTTLREKLVKIGAKVVRHSR